MEVPQALARLPQWIVWSYRGEDRRKVPYNPKTGKPAKSNDASTWTDLATAQSLTGQHSGLGFVFSLTDGLFGIDLDGCIAPDGELAEWASEIIDELNTYAELSPSGTGVKLFGVGKVPGSTGKKKAIDVPSCCEKPPGLEIYDKGRYFAFTGEHFTGTPTEPQECQAALDAICGRFWPQSVSVTPTWSNDTPIDDRAAKYLDRIPVTVCGTSSCHDRTFRVACVLILGFAIEGERAFGLLKQWAATGEHEWTDKELWHKITDAGRQIGERGWLLDGRGYSGPDVELSRLLASLDADEDEIEQAPINPGELTPDCLCPPGLIREIIKYNLRTAIYPQPVLALAAAIAMMGTLIGRKVTDCYGTRANVFVLGLAPSGSGKEHARKVNKEILIHALAEKMIGPERIGSSAGVVTAVYDNPVILMQIDEIGRLLETMKNPGKSPHLYNVATVLMQMYGASDSLWIGDAYADAKKVKRINQPHPVLYGTSTPDKFWESLTVDNMTDGFLGRLLPFEAAGDGYADKQRPAIETIPGEIITAAKWWLDFNPTSGNLGDQNPKPVVAEFTPDALSRLESHMDEIVKRRKRDDDVAAALWSRAGGKTSKLALIFACSRQTFSACPMIQFEDVDRAVRISNMLTRKTLRKAFDHVSRNDYEKQSKDVMRLLAKPLTQREITRKTQWLRRRDREEILTSLVESGLVEMRTEDTKGRPRTVYTKR